MERKVNHDDTLADGSCCCYRTQALIIPSSYSGGEASL
jgi:hypothetical protein